MNADDLPFDELGENRYFGEVLEDDPDPILSNGFPVTTTAGTYSVTSSASHGGYKITGSIPVSTNPPSTPARSAFEIFCLSELGIATEGSFDSAGSPTGWIVNHAPMPIHYPTSMHNEPVLMCDTGPDYIVKVRGIFSRHYTNERRAALGLGPL